MRILTKPGERERIPKVEDRNVKYHVLSVEYSACVCVCVWVWVCVCVWVFFVYIYAYGWCMAIGDRRLLSVICDLYDL
jgi:hypothetical protein